MALYRTYSDYLKERYNEKVYKIPIVLPATCLNRDGTLDSGGCILRFYSGGLWDEGGGHRNHPTD